MSAPVCCSKCGFDLRYSSVGVGICPTHGAPEGVDPALEAMRSMARSTTEALMQFARLSIAERVLARFETTLDESGTAELLEAAKNAVAESMRRDSVIQTMIQGLGRRFIEKVFEAGDDSPLWRALSRRAGRALGKAILDSRDLQSEFSLARARVIDSYARDWMARHSAQFDSQLADSLAKSNLVDVIKDAVVRRLGRP